MRLSVNATRHSPASSTTAQVAPASAGISPTSSSSPGSSRSSVDTLALPPSRRVGGQPETADRGDNEVMLGHPSFGAPRPLPGPLRASRVKLASKSPATSATESVRPRRRVRGWRERKSEATAIVVVVVDVGEAGRNGRRPGPSQATMVATRQSPKNPDSIPFLHEDPPPDWISFGADSGLDCPARVTLLLSAERAGEESMDPIDGGLLLLRIVVGLTIIAHGVNHARNLEGTARWFARVGFRMAPLQARMSAVTEIGAGALLVAGFLTPLAAAAIIATMTVAAGIDPPVQRVLHLSKRRRLGVREHAGLGGVCDRLDRWWPVRVGSGLGHRLRRRVESSDRDWRVRRRGRPADPLLAKARLQ